ncbi:MAG: Calcineurin-like phosphoesterase [Pelotomaculum sp. PtaB.Bin104]|nr:MAG: Calcineurin-like phosphoesterase [Pelotomaculum sp. PtaB.Bin104]
MLKKVRKAFSTVLLCATILTASFPTVAHAAYYSAQTPSQIGLAMTSEPTNSIIINWTTIDTTLTDPVVQVWQANKDESSAVEFTAQAEKRAVTYSTMGAAEKNFYSATITGLKPNTQYSYRCGTEEEMSEVHSFETAPDNNGKYTFIYFSDSQVAGNHSLAWQANLDIAEEMYPDAKFIYIAGDLTDKAQNEGQWEAFFNQPGNAMFNEDFSGNLISELPLAAAMGNHDAGSGGVGGMASHYTWGSEVNGVPVSYAFDYGAARIIILNLESAYSQNSEAYRLAQTEFLEEEVAQAKAEGKWTFVGYHKALYSGANHMDDGDVINNRKYWAPKFAELDVDFVLQGHDHVLSRGFITADGYAADITRQVSDREYMAKDPDNAPLYYCGNTGSSLKFYAPIMDDSWIQPGDPVSPQFGYLDINSALPAGYVSEVTGKVLNPGPCTNDDLEGQDLNFFRTPTFTAVTVSNGTIEFDTYMTGFDPNTNSIVKDTFLYDSIKVTR